MPKAIDRCRACKSTDLKTMISLGEQCLTGVFKSTSTQNVSSGPLDLVHCEKCRLLQMSHSYPLQEMYGFGYGYRSGATELMRRHLADVVKFATSFVNLDYGDHVIDIGSNDGTLLNCYSGSNLKMTGVDPVASKYLDLYPLGSQVLCEFFSEDLISRKIREPAKIITSVSMFYDLEDPMQFVKDVASILNPKGVWVFEQSYLPSMLRNNSYDTICHEHLEYYSFTVISNLLEAAGLKAVDVSQNGLNGGSLRVAAMHLEAASISPQTPDIQWLLNQESRLFEDSDYLFRQFENNIFNHKRDLLDLLNAIRSEGKSVLGYGASTKGNVILQYCGVDSKMLPAIGDITPEKNGTFTPGTNIPIISMEQAKRRKPDYFLVLPWSFRNDILLRERETLSSGTKFIFPLPYVEIAQ